MIEPEETIVMLTRLIGELNIELLAV